MNREAERKRLVELLKSGQPPFNPLNEVCIDKLADHLLDNGIIVEDIACKEAIFRAVNALADMVNQFGYSTTFRRKEAVCDGGLSALEEAFYALELCGARVNSNGTINRENLVNYKIENVIKEHLEAKDNV
jgi:hypothetical protein